MDNNSAYIILIWNDNIWSDNSSVSCDYSVTSFFSLATADAIQEVMPSIGQHIRSNVIFPDMSDFFFQRIHIKWARMLVNEMYIFFKRKSVTIDIKYLSLYQTKIGHLEPNRDCMETISGQSLPPRDLLILFLSIIW